MTASPRAFVLRHTRLGPVPGLEEVRRILVPGGRLVIAEPSPAQFRPHEWRELIRSHVEDDSPGSWRGPIAAGTAQAFLRRLEGARFYCGIL